MRSALPVSIELPPPQEPVQFASIVMTDAQIRSPANASPPFGTAQAGTFMWPLRTLFILNAAAGAYTNGPSMQPRTSPLAGGLIYGSVGMPVTAANTVTTANLTTILGPGAASQRDGRTLEIGFTGTPIGGNPSNTMQAIVPFVRVTL